MVSRWLPSIIIGSVLLAGLALVLTVQQRMAHCAYVPLFAEELLPNAALAIPGDSSALPEGWSAAAPGVQPGTFAVDGDGRSLQLMGIANYVQTPPVPVQPGTSYCFRGMAITDSHTGSTSRVRVTFRWLDSQGNLLAEHLSRWQTAVLWHPAAPPEHWSTITAAFRAPPGAATLLIRLHPSSDDRIYLDALHVRQGGSPARAPTNSQPDQPDDVQLVLLPWPEGKRAALSFSFDWETAMGGLIHSRSVDDPFSDQDPEQRGLRMREGITTTLDMFRPYGVRATYYATGYNFLHGNTERVLFMGNPTYSAWANTTNRWTSDRWQTTPWFAPDPYGTVESHPAWYFGDLVPRIQQAGHDIQSHTFSHFYGGFVGPDDWRDDIRTWNEVAAAQGIPPARSLAFPWSSSGGMSEANWQVLKEAGITSVTRLSKQSQFNLFPYDAQGLVQSPHCKPLPGHPTILACPDFYLTPASVGHAIEQIDRTLAMSGTIDIWSHTEEVVTPEQRAAWQRVVDYAVAQPDLWVAPLREIADWQQAMADVTLKVEGEGATGARFLLTNNSSRDLEGVTLALTHPTTELHISIAGKGSRVTGKLVQLDIAAGEVVQLESGYAQDADRR